MTKYSVHEKLGGVVDPLTDVVFVKSGFSVAAVVFGALWFVWHRMWFGLAGYCGALILLGGVVMLSGMHPAGLMLVQSLFALLLGFEAETIRRWHVERSGFREVAMTSGGTLDDAEMRYFAMRDRDRSAMDHMPAARPKFLPFE